MAEPKTRTTIPSPRVGAAGEWDKFVGPGAARCENAGTLGHGTPRGPLSALRRRRRSRRG